MTKVYAVFEGGGVKGIALVGALTRACKETRLEFKGFAGSSAGAIVAALAAVGYTAREMKKILEKLEYTHFLEDRDKVPFELLQGHVSLFQDLFSQAAFATFKNDVAQLWQKKSCRFALGLWKLWRKYRIHEPGFERLAKSLAWLIEHKGFYQTSYFLNWLRELMDEKAKELGIKSCPVTFRSLWEDKGILLKVVTTDIGRQRPLVYSSDEGGHKEIAEAVQASMSIPLFFRPYADGSNFFVDGGMVSNFPAWVFDKEQEDERNATAASGPEREKDITPVIGFRLVPEKPPVPCLRTFGDYALGLYRTALGGTDRLQTRRVARLFLIPIPISPTVSSTKFDLNDQEKEILFVRGEQAAETFFKDPDNRRALDLDLVLT